MSSGTNDSLRSSASSWPWRLASPSRATHWVAVANCTRCPARHARIPSAVAMWVLPVPGGPSRITFSLAVQEVELAEVLDHRLLHRALEGEVELLQRFAGGEPGGLDPALTAVAVAGGDLGAEQHLGEALIAPGLLPGPVSERRQRPARRRVPSSARNRCASSACLVMPGSAGHSGTAAGSRPRPGGAGGVVSRWRSSWV